jgi:hypothetical protein
MFGASSEGGEDAEKSDETAACLRLEFGTAILLLFIYYYANNTATPGPHCRRVRVPYNLPPQLVICTQYWWPLTLFHLSPSTSS